MKYIYQLKDWPNWRWDAGEVADALAEVSMELGKFLGRLSSIGFAVQKEAVHEMLSTEILESAAIEGEQLNRDDVRSSVARRMDSWIGGAKLPAGGDGWVKLYVNGVEKMTLHQGDAAETTWTAGQDQVEFSPGELQAGWNEFELRGSSVSSSAYYLFDYIRFSVLKESRGFMLTIR